MSMSALAIIGIMALPGFAEYRYALIVDAADDNETAPVVTALKVQGFQCEVADWDTERDFKNAVSRFVSRTATNSTLLLLYRGQVSATKAKSKEFRGEESPGIHFSQTADPYPLVDLIDMLNTTGGCRTNILYLDAEDRIEPPLSDVPDGFTVALGRTSKLVEKIKKSDALAEPVSTAISSPKEFVVGSKLGDEWVNDRGMVFLWCPPGAFIDSSGDQVNVDDGFWMMKHEWTRGQIMGKGDLRKSPGNHKLHALGNFGLREMPGMLKRWNTDERKAGRLPQDYEYALPTEAQWEYAARAGSRSSYCFGDDVNVLASYANFADKSYYDTRSIYSNYGHRTLDDGQASVAVVGLFKPNAWGFHDMHGNVSEFCENGACRGGSWISAAESCRFNFRDGPWGHSVGEYQGYRFVIRKVAAE